MIQHTPNRCRDGAAMAVAATLRLPMNREGPSVLAMIAAVAVLVALVILIFFGIGYLFGRQFL